MKHCSRHGTRSGTRCAVAYAVFAGAMLVGALAQAQTVDESAAAPYGVASADDQLYWHALLDELEGRFLGGPDPAFRWDGEAWVGSDSNRLWLKSEAFAMNGAVEDSDQELLYARPISTYFDLQAGVRYDLDSRPGRGWAAFGVEGLAAYFFQLSATLYASDAGHFAGKVFATYDARLTQRLILEPLVELDAYTRSDPARAVGSGVSDIDAGLRLRYEISRKFAPYLGVVYERAYAPFLANGPNRQLLDANRSGDWRLAIGVKAWL